MDNQDRVTRHQLANLEALRREANARGRRHAEMADTLWEMCTLCGAITTLGHKRTTRPKRDA